MWNLLIDANCNKSNVPELSTNIDMANGLHFKVFFI